MSRRRKDGSERSAGSDVKARRSFVAKWRNVSDCRRVSDERIKCPLTDGFHRYFSPKIRTETKKSVNIRIIEGITGYNFVIELVSRFLIGLEEINAEVSVLVKDF